MVLARVMLRLGLGLGLGLVCRACLGFDVYVRAQGQAKVVVGACTFSNVIRSTCAVYGYGLDMS